MAHARSKWLVATIMARGSTIASAATPLSCWKNIGRWRVMRNRPVIA
jgi:hypothetical protein